MVSNEDLLECGVHFGHQTKKMESKMKNSFSVLEKTFILLTYKNVKIFQIYIQCSRDRTAEGQTMIFVGTKTN